MNVLWPSWDAAPLAMALEPTTAAAAGDGPPSLWDEPWQLDDFYFDPETMVRAGWRAVRASLRA